MLRRPIESAQGRPVKPGDDGLCTCGDLPVGHFCVESFFCFSEKYFCSHLTQIKSTTLASDPTEGRIAIVTDAGRGAVDAAAFCARCHESLHQTPASFRDAPLGAGPESILPVVVMDSGLALRAPRNDGSQLNWLFEN